MAEHTPTPWVAVSKPDFHNGLTYTSIQPVTPDVVTTRPLLMASGEHHVCRMTHTAARHAIDLHQANAAFIVKAVNSYEATQDILVDIWFLFSATDDPTLRKIADRARDLIHDPVGSVRHD